MDDFSEMLSSVLNNPQSMEQLKQTAQQLFNSSNETALSPVASEPEDNGTFALITKIAPLLRAAEGENDAMRLLAALKPFLGDTRRKKADEAGKILQIIKILPALKQQNLF